MGKEKVPIKVTEAIKDNGPMVARLEGIGFATYDRVLFEDLSLNIKKGDVISLTGKSGSGKTVLIKILAGIAQQQTGSVVTKPFSRVSYFPQELDDIDVDQNTTIRQFFKDARGLTVIEDRMRELESNLSGDSTSCAANLEEYGNLSEQYQDLNGYEPEPEMQIVLAGLGVDEHSTGNITLDSSLSAVSSGQLKKIMIARTLFSMPDLMLLDDPTSHLDVASVQWLADYLKGTKAAVVIATNNQVFLDKCSSKTVGLTDSGRTFSFEGNYSDFILKRDSIIEAEILEAKSVSNKLEDLRATDMMFRSKQVYKRSADMAQVGRALATRMKRLEERHADMPGSQNVYREERVKDLVFSSERRSGQDVVTINRVLKRYEDHVAVDLTKSDPIHISQGDRWLVWGANGSGKSTLLRMIAQEAIGGSFTPDQGTLSIGASVDTAYFAPDINMISNKGLLLDEATSITQGQNQGRAVAALMFFGFSQSTIRNLDVSLLSFGEKKRLSLAKIMLKNPNLLILDEPTGDYMSDETKTRLASALRGYNGTLLLVSHDIDFISQLKINRELRMPAGRVLIKD